MSNAAKELRELATWMVKESKTHFWADRGHYERCATEARRRAKKLEEKT